MQSNDEVIVYFNYSKRELNGDSKQKIDITLFKQNNNAQLKIEQMAKSA